MDFAEEQVGQPPFMQQCFLPASPVFGFGLSIIQQALRFVKRLFLINPHLDNEGIGVYNKRRRALLHGGQPKIRTNLG